MGNGKSKHKETSINEEEIFMDIGDDKESYEELREKLNQAELRANNSVDASLMLHNELETEREKLFSALKNLELLNDTMDALKKDFEEKEDLFCENINKKSKELEKLQAKFNEEKDEHRIAEDELAYVLEKQKSTENQLEELQTKFNEEKDEHRIAEDELAYVLEKQKNTEIELKNVENKNKILNDEKEEFERQFNAAESVRKYLSEILENTKQEYESEIESLKGKKQDFINKFKIEKQNFEIKLENLEKEKIKLAEKNKTLEEENQYAKKQIEITESERLRLANSLEESQSKIIILNNVIEKLRNGNGNGTGNGAMTKTYTGTGKFNDWLNRLWCEFVEEEWCGMISDSNRPQRPNFNREHFEYCLRNVDSSEYKSYNNLLQSLKDVNRRIKNRVSTKEYKKDYPSGWEKCREFDCWIGLEDDFASTMKPI